jgi:hypothetical protein
MLFVDLARVGPEPVRALGVGDLEHGIEARIAGSSSRSRNSRIAACDVAEIQNGGFSG